MSDVVIVGAGFSHAVSERYPLTDELGRLTLERAGIPEKDRPPAGSRFEVLVYRVEGVRAGASTTSAAL